MKDDDAPDEEPAVAADDEVETLEGVTSGRWVVTTEHGTRHLLDLDRRHAIRVAGPGRRQWGAGGIGLGPTTPDGFPLRFWSIRTATVGERMRLDNREEWRITTTVVSIRRCSDAEWERIVAEELS